MKTKAILITIAALLSCSTYSSAQIQVDQLTPASAYDAGAIDTNQGGLSPDLWQNSDAATAARLINKIPADLSEESLAAARAALLSAGVPPAAADGLDRTAYLKARLGKVLQMGDLNAFDTLAEVSDPGARDQGLTRLYADRALQGGNAETACTISDSITAERRLPEWAKLRAYCHLLRDEIPAAELTADLLRRSGHKDDEFFLLFGAISGSGLKTPKAASLTSPLHIAMARSLLGAKPDTPLSLKNMPAPLAAAIALSEQEPADRRFEALKSAAKILQTVDIAAVLNGLAGEESADEAQLLAVKTWTGQQFGQAYKTLQTSADMQSRAALAARLLEASENSGMFGPISSVLNADINIIPHSLQAQANAPLFARFAISNRDLSALRGLYEGLDEDNLYRPRIALASDAIGGGFYMAPLGVDIEAGLNASGNKKDRAVRDTFLAIALGASLSLDAANDLGEALSLPGAKADPALLLALKSSARRNAKAETALWASRIFSATPPAKLRSDELSDILHVMNTAGLRDQAANIAAQDFIR